MEKPVQISLICRGSWSILLEFETPLTDNAPMLISGKVAEALDNLLSKCLGISPGERLVFIHDREYRIICPDLKDAAIKKGVLCDFLEIEHDGIRPLDGKAAELIVGPDYGVILFGTVHNVWHAQERRKAKYDLKKRLAALVCPPEEIGATASLADVQMIGAAAREMAHHFVSGMKVRVTTPAGSDFSAAIGIPFCEHGNYNLPGTGGDFPSGEVGFGPEEGSVNGRIVYDVKVQHIGLLHEPLYLEVKDDCIREVSGEQAQRFRTICADRGNILNYISEISIGLNPFADVTAAPAYIPEEKTLGTLHCGHGGNASYGNRNGPHIDGVMSSPTVKVGNQILMKDGVIQAGLIKDSILEWLTQPK